MLPNGVMHEVSRHSSREVAELDHALLQEHGIEAFVAADDCGGVWSGLTATEGARVLVADVDLERARAALAKRRS